MYLIERHVISRENKSFLAFDNICFLSKNLYNYALYETIQYYKINGKTIHNFQLSKKLVKDNQVDFRALPGSVSPQILKILYQNIKSYFVSFKKYKNSTNRHPKFPKFKDKIKGRNIVIFNNYVFKVKNGEIVFTKKCNLPNIKTQINPKLIQYVRIIPQSSCYVVEVVYKVEEPVLKQNNNKASIDLGINNLAALTLSNSKDSFIINGKPLKSINQYYNKKLASLKSDLMLNHGKFTSNGTNKLTLKRNNKINDYLHKSSKKIVDLLVKYDVSELAIGYNKEWKQNINIGKVNNQKFVAIPYLRFIEQLKYKCRLKGINVITNEESYTSKCSALDLEPICKHEKYVGKRIKRGLFRDKRKRTINADINGSLNIGRKVFGNRFVMKFLVNRGYVHYPIKLTA
jgi:putative transposase